jgi:mannosyltransferase OCH1-like enzyme
MIPKILMQTTRDSIPDYVQDSLKQKLSDEWEYNIFNDESSIDFFHKNPLSKFPKIIEKYNKLKEGAHRSDLFRYYYHYLRGGIYLDDDSIVCNITFDELIKNCDCFFVKSNFNKFPEIVNAFFGVEPKNIIIEQALIDLYNVNPKKLTSMAENKEKYLRNVKILYRIFQKNKHLYNIRILEEMKNGNSDNPYVKFNDIEIWRHYYHDKIIPNL